MKLASWTFGFPVLAVLSLAFLPWQNAMAMSDMNRVATGLAAFTNLTSPGRLISLIRTVKPKEASALESFFRENGVGLNQPLPTVSVSQNTLSVGGTEIQILQLKPLSLSYGDRIWTENSKSSFAENLKAMEKALLSKTNAHNWNVFSATEARADSVDPRIKIAAFLGGFLLGLLLLPAVTSFALGALGLTVALGGTALMGTTGSASASNIPMGKSIYCSNLTPNLSALPNLGGDRVSESRIDFVMPPNSSLTITSRNGKPASLKLIMNGNEKTFPITAAGKVEGANLSESQQKGFQQSIQLLKDTCSSKAKWEAATKEMEKMNQLLAAHPPSGAPSTISEPNPQPVTGGTSGAQ